MGSERDRGIRAARRRVALSALLNLALAAGKTLFGITAQSGALVADGIHSLTDFFASAALYAGLWIAGRRHPSFHYGLYKAETVATLVVSGGILMAAYEIARRAVVGGEAAPDVGVALPVAAVTLAVSVAFGLYQLHGGRRLASPALEADGRDYLADSLSSTVVFLSLLGAAYGLDLDRWGAAVVALFVFKSGGELLFNSLRDLMDGAIDRETERRIIAMVENHPRVGRVKRCLSRKAGGRFIVDLDVLMQTPSHRVADQVADRLEEEIPAAFPRVVMARVRPHFGPAELLRRMTPVSGPDRGEPCPPEEAAWFLLEEVAAESGAVIGRRLLENPFPAAAADRDIRLGGWILSQRPDIFTIPAPGDGPLPELLRQAGVEVRVV